jgi:tellurite resistance protein
MSGASVEDGITDNELAAMIEMLREGSGLNSDYTSSVEAIYKLKSAIEMSSSMNLNSSDVRQAIAEAIASSSPTINDASDVMIIGTTVASVRRRHLTAEQSFRIDYEISLNRSQSANVNPKQTAADMRNAMSSPAFKEFLSKFGIEASVTYVAPTRIAVKVGSRVAFGIKYAVYRDLG